MRHPQPLCMVALVFVLSSPVLGSDALSVTDVPSAARDNPLAAWALDLLSETRDRPLFSLSRRPPPPPALPPPEFAAPAPETPPPTIVLLAIVSEDGVAHAVVRTAEHKAVEKIKTFDFDTLVSRHVKRTGTRADVELQSQFMNDLKAAAGEALKSARPGEGVDPCDLANPWGVYDKVIKCVNTLTPRADKLAAFDVFIWD